MDDTLGDFLGLGPAFFRPLYGALAPIPAAWEDTTWYDFVDPADGSKYSLKVPGFGPGHVEPWLEENRAQMPPGTPVVTYQHPTLVVRGLTIRPDPASPDSLYVIFFVGPFGVRRLMITGPLGQADVQAFVSRVAPDGPGAPEMNGWVALGLSLPLSLRALPPAAFEFRSADAVLSIEWTADSVLPAPDLQAFGDEAEILRGAGPEHFEESETARSVERTLVPASLGLPPAVFVAQIQFFPKPESPALWRSATPYLRVGLSGKVPASASTGLTLNQIWTDLRSDVVFLARASHA
jgi:hypothetical protein